MTSNRGPMNDIQKNRDNFQRQLWPTALRWAARLTIACLILCLFGGSGLVETGWADGGANVSIAPASQEIFLGGTGTTDVLVEDVTDLYVFEFQIAFDPTLVEVVQIQPGDFLSPDWLLENSVDNDNGTLAYALCQLNPSPPQSGDGVLATITWRGKVMGTSPITLTYMQLGAPLGVPIPASTQDGEITVGEPSPGPTITSLSPDSATTGGPAFTLTVNGTGFVSGSTVHWDGSARATTFVSSTQLTAAIAASDVATADTANVTVVNPAPGGGTSNALPFTIANPAPTLTSLSPVSATAGGPAFTLTVNGSNFASGSTMQWDGSARATTFVSDTQLTAGISASDVITAGTVSITVANLLGPGGGVSNALPFEVTEFSPEPPPNLVYLPLVLNND